MGIPTLKTIRKLGWLDKTDLGEARSGTLIRQLMVYGETGEIKPGLESFMEEGPHGGVHLYELDQHRYGDIGLAMRVMDSILDTFGVEYIPSADDTYNRTEGLDYLNTGDTYTPTVIYDYGKGRWMITSWGDIVEREEKRFAEGGGDWYNNPIDEATELKIFVDNDGTLYRQMTTSIHKNLVNKMASGKYDSEKGAKAFLHLADAGAKKYTKEHGSRGAVWHKMFPIADRREAAVMLRDEFEEEARLGNFDHLLHKKYSKKGRRNPSMTYGQLPSKREFVKAYHTALGYDDYHYTLRGIDADVAYDVGIPDAGFFDVDELWDTIKDLKKAYEHGNDEAGDLASGFLTTLGFEWI